MYTKQRYTRVSAGVIKLMYFLLYAGFASWMTYFFVYMKDDCHLGGVEIGTLAASQQLNNLVFLPLWGMIADRYGRRKIFLLTLGVSSILLLVFMIQGSFWFYLVCVLVFSAIYNPVASLLDGIALELCAESGATVSYGNMRLWASLGWAMSAAITGWLVSPQWLFTIFPAASIILLVTWVTGLFFYKKKSVIARDTSVSVSALWHLVTHDSRLLLFFIFISMFYVLNAPIMMFINLYYKEIGGTNMHIGMAFAVQSVCELPFFFWGDRLVGRYGAKQLMLFSMVVAAVRMFLYGATSSPWVAIGIGGLHGITLGLFLVAVVAYAHSIIPPAQKSTGQSLLYTFLGLGACLGNLANGFFKDFLSLRAAMVINACLIVMLVAGASVMLRYRGTRR
jgi:PPP family 3-phenylpropionic acid transporter